MRKPTRSEIRALREANAALTRPRTRLHGETEAPLALIAGLTLLLILAVTAYL